MRFGVHVSIGGGLARAVEEAQGLGCETMQIFAGNPRGWQRRALSEPEGRAVTQALEATGIGPLVVHCSYLVNLASPKPEIYEKSCEVFIEDLKRCDAMGAEYFVLHPGSHLGSGLKEGMGRIAAAFKRMREAFAPKVRVLLENVAGGGSDIGGSFSELRQLADMIGESHEVGVCLDTCHAFAAGYDLRTPAGWRATLDEFDRELGMDKLRALHCNDSKGTLGSHLDRHAGIGEGHLGVEGFAAMATMPELQGLSGILEIPIETREDYLANLARIREIWASAHKRER